MACKKLVAGSRHTLRSTIWTYPREVQRFASVNITDTYDGGPIHDEGLNREFTPSGEIKESAAVEVLGQGLRAQFGQRYEGLTGSKPLETPKASRIVVSQHGAAIELNINVIVLSGRLRLQEYPQGARHAQVHQ
jgi:hypothetical protein